MSMHALNRMLGCSTIDPSIEQAFVEGRVRELLAEYELAPALRAELCGLEAETFTEFAALAYQVVAADADSPSALAIPSPLDGLTDHRLRQVDDRAA